ncbi:MAG: hypothetical protein Alpg2KO_13300 [Alphaproteobacteria bacterium]
MPLDLHRLPPARVQAALASAIDYKGNLSYAQVVDVGRLEPFRYFIVGGETLEKMKELHGGKLDHVGYHGRYESELGNWMDWTLDKVTGCFSRSDRGQFVPTPDRFTEPVRSEKLGDKVILKVQPVAVRVTGFRHASNEFETTILAWPEPPGCTPITRMDYAKMQEAENIDRLRPDGGVRL